MSMRSVKGSEDRIMEAAKDEDTVIKTQPNLLLIDIDTEEQAKTLEDRKHEIVQIVNSVRTIHEYPSKAGLPHKHVVLQIGKDLDIISRLMFQLYLGSDPTRELLSYILYLRNDPCPSLLVKPKETKDE
jgi:hypothetical protein